VSGATTSEGAGTRTSRHPRSSLSSWHPSTPASWRRTFAVVERASSVKAAPLRTSKLFRMDHHDFEAVHFRAKASPKGLRARHTSLWWDDLRGRSLIHGLLAVRARETRLAFLGAGGRVPFAAPAPRESYRLPPSFKAFCPACHRWQAGAHPPAVEAIAIISPSA
jgi:hypothetical protein